MRGFNQHSLSKVRDNYLDQDIVVYSNQIQHFIQFCSAGNYTVLWNVGLEPDLSIEDLWYRVPYFDPGVLEADDFDIDLTFPTCRNRTVYPSGKFCSLLSALVDSRMFFYQDLIGKLAVDPPIINHLPDSGRGPGREFLTLEDRCGVGCSEVLVGRQGGS